MQIPIDWYRHFSYKAHARSPAGSGNLDELPGNDGPTAYAIALWHRLGDYAAGLANGTHLQVEGEVHTRDYVEKTGKKAAEVKKCITEIRATAIVKLDRPKKDATSDPEGAAA